MYANCTDEDVLSRRVSRDSEDPVTDFNSTITAVILTSLSPPQKNDGLAVLSLERSGFDWTVSVLEEGFDFQEKDITKLPIPFGGAACKFFRKKKGISLSQFGDWANIDRSNLHRIENEGHYVKLAIVELYSKLLGIDVKEIVTQATKLYLETLKVRFAKNDLVLKEAEVINAPNKSQRKTKPKPNIRKSQ